MPVLRKLLPVVLPLVATVAAAQNRCHFTTSAELAEFLRPGKHARPLIMAHQGGIENGLAGNSMAAFKYTYQQVDCVLLEFDVRMSSDGQLIISHDDELPLRTNGTGLASKTSWKDLKKLRLKTEAGVLTTSPIPSFDEVLRWSQDKNLVLVVDKKPGTAIAKVINALQKTKNLGKAVLICYSLDEAREAHQIAPDLMLAVGFNSPQHIDAIKKSGLPQNRLLALTPRELQPKSFYDTIHEMNVVASLGTNGNIDTLDIQKAAPNYRKIAASGPDIICTDHPDAVQKLFTTVKK